MIKYLRGAPKVKIFERDIRKNDMTDAELLRRSYDLWKNQGIGDGGSDDPSAYIPPPPPEESGTTECGDFNLDFSEDFFLCDNPTDSCGSFNSAFNSSFHNCTGEGENNGSFSTAHDYSYDVYR